MQAISTCIALQEEMPADFDGEIGAAMQQIFSSHAISRGNQRRFTKVGHGVGMHGSS